MVLGSEGRLGIICEATVQVRRLPPERTILGYLFPSWAESVSAMRDIAAALGEAEILPLAIPLHCTDGFSEAYYGRPERLLEPGARLANSAWSFLDPSVGERFVEHLGRDLADGSWDRRHGHLRSQPFFKGSLKLVVGRP